MKAPPYLVVDGGYAGLPPSCEVAEGQQSVLGAALVGVDVVLPWREERRAPGTQVWHRESATQCHPTPAGGLAASPFVQGCSQSPSDLIPQILSPSLFQRAACPFHRLWRQGQSRGPPCPWYRRAGRGEPAAAPCRWWLGWFWCHWDAPQGLGAPGSGCPAEPRPRCNSVGWRNK